MTKNSRNRSMLAWLLTFALLLSLVPAQAFAQDTGDNRQIITSADFWGVEMPTLNSQKTEADFKNLLKTTSHDPYSVEFLGLETETGDPITLPYTFSQPGQQYKAKYKVSAKSGFVFNEHPKWTTTTITGKTIESSEQLTATNTPNSSSFTMQLPLTVANEPLLSTPPTNLRIEATDGNVKVKFEAPKSEKAYTAKIYLLNNEEPSPIGAEAQESMTKPIDANKDTQIVEWDITSALTSVGQWRARLVYKPESSNDYLYGSKLDSNVYEVMGYTVKITGGGISGASPDGKYAKGETITIGADDAPEGQVFDKWEVVSGGITIKHPEQRQTTFTMPANDVEIKATYKAKTYPVTVEGGKLVADSTHTDNNYEKDATVTIKANDPEAGMEFDKWVVDGGTNVDFANANEAQTTFKMPAGEVKVKATYKAKPAPAPEKYLVTVEGGKLVGDSVPSDMKYAQGETVKIVAGQEPSGQVFDKWEVLTNNVTLTDASQAQNSFTMPAGEVKIKATYKAKTYPVTVEGGMLVADSAHADKMYAKDEQVSIKANDPEPGMIFDKWEVLTKNVTLTDAKQAQTTFKMPAGEVKIRATYTAKPAPTPKKYLVTVDGGTLVGDSVPNDKMYAKDETVTIKANAPEAGMVFDKWEVLTNNVTLTDATQAQTTFTMPAGEVKVKATYKTKPTPAPKKYLVTVEGGKLVGDSVPSDKKYAQGETVKIVAGQEPSGQVFDKWEVLTNNVTLTDASQAQNSFTMPAGEVKIKATYKAKTYPVTVEGGTLVADSAHADKKYAENETVTIKANAPEAGKVFKQWEVVAGSTSVTFANPKEAQTTFTMPAGEVKVKATYKAKPAPAPEKYLVTVEGGKLVGDSVPSDMKYAQGETVKIVAGQEPSGQVFDKWEVLTNNVTLTDASQAQNSFTMPAGEVKIKATYKAKPVPAPEKYLVTVENGMLTGTVPSDKKYAKGEMVKIVANPPETGKVFDKWVVVGSTGVTFANANEGSTSFTMPANAVTVKATYRNVASSGSSSSSFSYYHPNSTNQTPKKPETPQTDQPKVTEDGKISVKNFTDIDKHWANNAIAYCVERNIMRGMSEKTFAPNMPVTRGMFVTILGNLSGVETANYTAGKFSDSMGKYYSPYVNWANESGITQGIASDKFMPDMAINREQLAVMIVKYAKQANLELGSKMPQKAYSDANDISPWAKDAVNTLQMSGLMSGQNANHFNPKAKATRAEICVIMQKLAMLSDKK